MKKLLLILTGCCLATAAYSQSTPHFATDPTLSPDGKTAYFSFDSDIWKVPVSGGEALRITALEGVEINPRVSPDGKWLAFSSNQYGNFDIFVMPLEGGEIRQLTWHQATDRVENWSWDSKKIYFTSDRYNSFGSYSVDLAGGTAKRLFTHFFNTSNALAETPSGEYIFTNTMESDGQATRKRYKGENNPDLLGYHPKTGKFTQYTSYNGKDLNPTVDKNGIIYFSSDEKNGEYNLYAIHKGVKTALTEFPTSIRRPAVSANGEKVIFEKDYRLFIYEVANKQTRPLDFRVGLNNSLIKNQEFKTEGKISAFDVSPDGKKMAFVSRGELFVSDIKGKFIAKILETKERVLEVKWLKDNRTLLFNQTRNGYQNLYTVNADGSGNLKELTTDARNNRDITLNPALSQAVYLSGRDEVRLLDLATLQSSVIVKDEIWGFQNSAPSFSPDGEYVLFTAIRNFEQDIFIHHLKDKKTLNLTNTGVTEAGPVWSADGRSIYFLSNRTSPSYPFGMPNATVYRLALHWYSDPFRSDNFSKLFEDKKDSLTPKPIRIDTDGLSDRITPVSNLFGTQSGLQTFTVKDKNYIFYNSNEDMGRTRFFRTVTTDFEEDKTEKVADRPFAFMVKAADKFYVLTGGDIHTYSPESNKTEKIALSYKFLKNLENEFRQMYYEAWAGLEENFYNETFHGVDWKAQRDRYAAYLPFVNSRKDLRVLLGDLLGELNSSHLGFTSSGDEESTHLKYVTNETGIVFDGTDPYKIDHVVRKSAGMGASLQKGDILTAINGVKTDKSRDRDSYFTLPTLQEEITLELERNGKPFTVKIHPEAGFSFKDKLYDEWILESRKRVDQLSKNRIAYSHMKNMSTQALESFLLDMVEQENNKEATILDLRFNRGGNVHDKVLQFLAQRPYLKWQYRGGKLSPQSNFAPAGKPIVLLINESSLSDAEMTAAGFKALKLGTVIGTETYRWIIFTSGKSLVDGSFYRIPGWGCYTLDGQNLEFTGVTPDIYVKNTFEDRLKGNDPQLDRAVEEILKQLK
ncbi:MAG: PD40 domain-containing protein [Leadbetterella sp.]|nr:PD40 domain-containing protein [Leadbetterella sp.]